MHDGADLQLLLALLVAGHMLGDFVLQTRRMVLGKRQVRWLLAHTGVLTGAHLLCLLPLWSGPTIAVVLAVGVLHGIVDTAKGRLVHARGERFWPFAVDQVLHLLILVAAAYTLLRFPGQPWFPSLPLAPEVRYGAWLLAAYAFNVNGSSSLVRLALRRFTPPAPRAEGAWSGEDDQPGAGRIIGVLERLLALTLVLLDQWGALGLVLAAKSIARFKDLDERMSAEYYLIGTLTSLLLAVGSALLLRAAL